MEVSSGEVGDQAERWEGSHLPPLVSWRSPMSWMLNLTLRPDPTPPHPTLAPRLRTGKSSSATNSTCPACAL